VLGVVIRGVKKHYVNVKTEQTLSALWQGNEHCRSLGRTAQDLASLFVSHFVIPYMLNIHTSVTYKRTKRKRV